MKPNSKIKLKKKSKTTVSAVVVKKESNDMDDQKGQAEVHPVLSSADMLKGVSIVFDGTQTVQNVVPSTALNFLESLKHLQCALWLLGHTEGNYKISPDEAQKIMDEHEITVLDSAIQDSYGPEESLRFAAERASVMRIPDMLNCLEAITTVHCTLYNSLYDAEDSAEVTQPSANVNTMIGGFHVNTLIRILQSLDESIVYIHSLASDYGISLDLDALEPGSYDDLNVVSGLALLSTHMRSLADANYSLTDQLCGIFGMPGMRLTDDAEGES